MKSPQAIKIVAIVGNGRMGTGISQVFASRGMDVRLIGPSEESLANRERYLVDLRRAGVPEK